MEGYVITTHLIANPKITFYYKGTADEEGVTFAMNTIVGFDILDAMVFHVKEDAVQLCEKLNEDGEILIEYGYEPFEMLVLKSKQMANSHINAFPE